LFKGQSDEDEWEENEAALNLDVAGKQAELESAQTGNDAALNAAETVMTAHKESHQEDMGSFSVQLAATAAEVAELIGRVSVVHKDPDV
jgi:hypothetical protein